MRFSIRCIEKAHARAIVTWRYEPPYALYNLSEDEVDWLLDPANGYYSVVDGTEALAGFCCFGLDARVVGGYYRAGPPDVLDVGVGMRPDLTGQGHGSTFVTTVLAFGRERFLPAVFRVTIAAFNERSRRVFESLGFAETRRFERPTDGLAFAQLEREARS